MKSNLVAIILAIVVVGGFFYYQNKSGGVPAASPAAVTAATTTVSQPSPSTATKYDACLAQGASLLPADSTKCLTKDGHVFIQGVTE